MAYQPYVIENFRGLDLRNPLRSTGALDIYNMVSDVEGLIATRYGYGEWATLASGTNYALAEVGVAANKPYLIVSTSSASGAPRTKALDITDASEDASLSKYTLETASFGTTSANYVLCAVGDGTTIQQFNGSSFAAVSYSGTNPIAQTIAVKQPSNRVAIAGSALGGGSRVQFSDPDDHTTWGANNFVDLTPGDGEKITCLVGWRDLLFAFKQTKFFVFYDESTDSDGNPVFNYRAVNGVGAARPFHSTCAVSTPKGVCFYGDGGVGSYTAYHVGAYPPGLYLTDGVGVEHLTEQITPAFKGSAEDLANTPGLTYGSWDMSQVTSVSRVGDQLWVPILLDNGTTYIVYVYDLGNKESYIHKFANGPLDIASVEGTSQAGNLNGTTALFVANGTSVYNYDTDLATDNGTAIASGYTTALSHLGTPGQVKKIRETLFWGSGLTAAVDVSVRVIGSDGNSAVETVSFPYPPTDPARHRKAVRGVHFGTIFTCTSGRWGMYRMAHNVNLPMAAAGRNT